MLEDMNKQLKEDIENSEKFYKALLQKTQAK